MSPGVLITSALSVISIVGAGGIAAVVQHGQQIAGIEEEERLHEAEDAQSRKEVQDQLDRRFGELERTDIGQVTSIATVAARQAINETTIATLKSKIEELEKPQEIDASFRREVEAIGKRIDDLDRTLSELQRQLSAVEGKLGESLPNPPHGR